MASSYKIHKVISQSRKSGGMQVVVLVNGKSVTRHIQRGKGYNPDSRTIPMHKAADKRLRQLEDDKVRLTLEIQRLTRILEDDELKQGKRKEYEEFLSIARDDAQEVGEKLLDAQNQITHLAREMPLTADFVL